MSRPRRPRCIIGSGGFVFLALSFALACKVPTAEDEFIRRSGHPHDCMLGRIYSDCEELARLEKTQEARQKWLELGCTHARGDLCVQLVGTWDYPAKEFDDARAISFLDQGCAAKQPGRACAELLYRRINVLGVATGSNEGLDAEGIALAERACALGAPGVPPMMGFGPTPCYFVARAYEAGIAGKPKDPARAELLLEQACEQELAFGPAKAGPSCFYAARLLRGQPMSGDAPTDAKPIDEARAKAFLERGCRNQQRDSCTALGRPLPP